MHDRGHSCIISLPACVSLTLPPQIFPFPHVFQSLVLPWSLCLYLCMCGFVLGVCAICTCLARTSYLTDIVDGPKATLEEFRSNLVAATTALQAKLPMVLQALGGGGGGGGGGGPDPSKT